jgi:hypothetical protein
MITICALATCAVAAPRRLLLTYYLLITIYKYHDDSGKIPAHTPDSDDDFLKEPHIYTP